VLAGTLAAVMLIAACAHADRAPNIELRDDLGRPWSLDRQEGGVIIVFGYTHCADTCPLTLAKLHEALERAALAEDRLQVAFVTVDPQRDTPNVLHAYLSRLGPRFVGLTGTSSELASVEQRYHVWAQRLPSKNGTYDYDEAHSSTIFFIDRHRAIASLHDPGDTIGELVRAIESL
jgi:protein SCO1